MFFEENPKKHVTVFSPETVNIKILANLTYSYSYFINVTNT